jgi:hypothetical protein
MAGFLSSSNISFHSFEESFRSTILRLEACPKEWQNRAGLARVMGLALSGDFGAWFFVCHSTPFPLVFVAEVVRLPFPHDPKSYDFGYRNRVPVQETRYSTTFGGERRRITRKIRMNGPLRQIP